MGPAKLHEIYKDNFTVEWTRMTNVSRGLIAGRSYAANDCLPKCFDEMTKETNDTDIVRALRRLMEEMNKQMSVVMKMSKEVITERGGERAGGFCED